MARNSRKVIELDNALADCHRTIEQKDEDLRGQHQRIAELETRLQGLEINRHSMEEKLGSLKEKLGRSQERVQELEERCADPTQLPEVKGYIRRELQGVWKRGFLRSKEEVQKAYPDLDFSPIRSIEDVIVELSRASSSQASAVESDESDGED